MKRALREGFIPLAKATRWLMAKVILGNDPDVQALQEVESLEALRQFNRKYLKHAYPYALVINDRHRS